MENILPLPHQKKKPKQFLAVIQKDRSCVLEYSSAGIKALICILYNAIIQKAVTMEVF